MNKEYNNVVLVIGNGFDLDLGLPTSYSSFIRSPYFDNHVSELQKIVIPGIVHPTVSIYLIFYIVRLTGRIVGILMQKMGRHRK